MKKFVKFNINGDYLPLLENKVHVINNNQSQYLVTLPEDDYCVEYIHQINQKVDKNLYYDWEIFYQYTEQELDKASAFCVKISNLIEPCGEECGTKYNEGTACPICGAGRIQKDELHLSDFSSMTSYDIGKTIGGEIIVSKYFQELVFKHGLTGMDFQPIILNGKRDSDYYQLKTIGRVDISVKTRFGIDFFDTINVPCSEEKKINICGHAVTLPKEIYVCPNGDLLGLRLLSELFIKEKSFKKCPDDFMKTSQYVGVKRGVLRPEPLYVCSRKFYETVKKLNIKGMEFEIAFLSAE